MKRTSILKATCLALLTALAIPALAKEDQVSVYVYAVSGPVKTSANYSDWASNMVWNLYSNLNLSSNDLGYRLKADYVTEPSDLSSNNVWFAVRIVSKNPTNMFALSMLSATERSSDPNNYLANSYSVSGVSNAIYSPHAMGVIWGPGGARVSDTLLTYQDATNLVNEVDFIGLQTKYFQGYSNSYIQSYMNGFTNYLVTAAWSVMNGTNVMGLGQRTLQNVGSPIQPLLTMSAAGGSNTVGINMETNRTVIIKSTTNLRLSFSQWYTEGTYNSGDTIVRPMTNNPYRFYRAVLE